MDNSAIEEIINFLQVNDRLATAGQPTEEQFRAVSREGFEVVINLALHNDRRYSLPDEEGLVHSLGMTYVHIPVVFKSPKEEDLLAFLSAMDRYRDRKVLVHCAANKRVTAFLGLYHIIRLHQDRETAFTLMRDVWEPDDAWSSFIDAMISQQAN